MSNDDQRQECGGVKLSGTLDCRQQGQGATANSLCADGSKSLASPPKPHGHKPNWLAGLAKYPSYLIDGVAQSVSVTQGP